MRDRKFGYHWIWMMPTYGCMWVFAWLCKTTQSVIQWASIKYLEHKNPELKRIRKLSGITKQN